MINKPIVRALRRADLPSVSRILEATQLFPTSLLEDMATPFLDDAAPHIWLAAIEDERLVGFAYCEPERMTEATYNLLAIAVSPDRQGKGIGKCIVADVERGARAIGGRVLLVETSSLDEYSATRAFYDRLEYRREARIRDFYAENEDKIVFWKRL